MRAGRRDQIIAESNRKADIAIAAVEKAAADQSDAGLDRMLRLEKAAEVAAGIKYCGMNWYMGDQVMAPGAQVRLGDALSKQYK